MRALNASCSLPQPSYPSSIPTPPPPSPPLTLNPPTLPTPDQTRAHLRLYGVEVGEAAGVERRYLGAVEGCEGEGVQVQQLRVGGHALWVGGWGVGGLG